MDPVSFADQWVTGVTPLRLVRLAGLILLPYFYRKWRDDDLTLREQLTSWNVNLAFVGLVCDILAELLITIWVTVDAERAPFEVQLGIALLALATMLIALARVYFFAEGVKKLVATVRGWVSGRRLVKG